MDWRKLITRIWGWFFVSVCIVGIPHTARYAYIGVKSTIAEAKCLALEDCGGKGADSFAMRPVVPQNAKQRDALQLLFDTNPGYDVMLVPQR